MHSTVYEPLSHLRDGGGMFSGRLKYIMKKKISSRFVWRGLSSDVTAWARGCLACQRGKTHRHTRPSPSRSDVFLTFMWIW